MDPVFDAAVLAGMELPPTERGRERWKKILETATRLFEERGAANVSVGDIVAETGGSLATVYKWFGGKEDLFFGVLCLRLGELSTAVDLIQPEGHSVAESIDAFFRMLQTESPFRTVSAVFMESLGFPNYRARSLAVIEKNTNEPLARFFSRIREAHGVRFRFSDAEMALVLVRQLRGLFLEIALAGESDSSRFLEGIGLIKQVIVRLVEKEGAER